MQRFAILIFILLPLWAQAFHIVGGELTYEDFGNGVYDVRLTVYRDCFSAGAPFDDPARVGVFDGNGNFIQAFDFSPPFVTPVETTVDFACSDISSAACVEKGVYLNTITLEDNDSGYYLAYQRCCRNSTIQNLTSPDEFGATYVAFIPPSTLVETNSCPVFNDLPPVGLCMDLPFSFDHSADDIDGDSLVYSLCTPYHGASQDDPAPNIPSAPPWALVQWDAGFSVSNQISANPIFTIDSETGLMEGTPTQIGQYVMGVCVQEYREGILISEVRRDFQFNVVSCPTAVLASFTDLQNGLYCEGASVSFENESANASTFFWDFGDGGITSIDEEPTHTFSGPGEYTVTLVSEPGEICSDTAIAVYTIAANPVLSMLEPTLNCPGSTYSIALEGDVDDIVEYAWTLDSPDAPESSTGPGLTEFTFDDTGLNYISVVGVTDQGCEADDLITFEVPLSPVADILPIPNPCQGLTINFESQSFWATDLIWDFGGPGIIELNVEDAPVYTYDNSGTYTVTLIASAPETCEDVFSMEVEANPELHINIVDMDPQCFEGNAFDYAFETNATANATYSWDYDDSGLPVNMDSDPGVISFPAPGSYDVQLTVVEGPCSAFDIETAHVVEALDVAFITEGTGCAPHSATMIDFTTGGASNSYTWSFGDGSISYEHGSVSHPYPSPGVYDVSLTVQSTFGCLGEETVTIGDAITVAPSPTANFVMAPPFADINNAFLNVTSTALGGENCIYLIEGHAPMETCDFGMEFLTGGQYEITQVVTNEFGCEDRITAPFRVTGHSFYAPNAITLNQDGVNDFFVPVVSGEIVEYRLQIYDRWGKVIFETDEVGMPWVPSYAHVGMHAYRVTLRDSYNYRQIYEGTFSLLR